MPSFLKSIALSGLTVSAVMCCPMDYPREHPKHQGKAAASNYDPAEGLCFRGNEQDPLDSTTMTYETNEPSYLPEIGYEDDGRAYARMPAVTSSQDPRFELLSELERGKILGKERIAARKAKSNRIRQELEVKSMLLDVGDAVGVKGLHYGKGSDYSEYNRRQQR